MQPGSIISKVDSVLAKITGKRKQLALFESKCMQDAGKLALKMVKLLVAAELGYHQQIEILALHENSVTHHAE